MTDRKLDEVISFYHGQGFSTFICTDIAKDGMLCGPSVDLYQKLILSFPGIRLIASGGVGAMFFIQREWFPDKISEHPPSFFDDKFPCGKVPQVDSRFDMGIGPSASHCDDGKGCAVPDTQACDLVAVFFQFFQHFMPENKVCCWKTGGYDEIQNIVG